MTQRERKLLLVFGALGAFVALFGGFMLVNKAWGNLSEKDKQIAALEQEVQTSELRLLVLAKKQADYERWRAIALPADAAQGSKLYQGYFRELCRKHIIFLKTMNDGRYLGTGSARGGAAVITPLAFNVQLEATLPKLISFLMDFYQTNLPHVIRDLSVTRQPNDTEGRLDIALKIEVLSLPNAVNRDFLTALPGAPLLAIDVFTALKGGPAGLALGPWLATPTGAYGAQKLAAQLNAERDYRRLIIKNVFVGLTPQLGSEFEPLANRDILHKVQLTSITANIIVTEATLYNRRTGRFLTLRDEGGFNTFEIMDENDRRVLKGTVKAVATEDVVIEVNGKHYAVHIGQFLNEALEKELTATELKTFGVEPADSAHPATSEKEKPGEP